MQKFLTDPPPFLFFTGKGGVGKTSIACSSALFLAEQGHNVLLVSTDPASNIAQVFNTKIGEHITNIESVKGLSALEIDPQAAAKAYREKILSPVRGKLPDAVLNSIEEQLSGACTTEIAAFDEFTALLTDPALRQTYQYIIFDTAPTGHTIRLLQLPGAWNEFLEQGLGDASCLGPLAGLDKQRKTYAQAVDALSDPEQTRLILVARAQASTLDEVARTHIELSHIGLKDQFLVINGLYPQQDIKEDALANAIYEQEQQALLMMPATLKNLHLDKLTLLSNSLVSLDALRKLIATSVDLSFEHDIKNTKKETEKVQSAPIIIDNEAHHSLVCLIDELDKLDHGLIMLMGKGGVGKTTIAAALACELAKRGHNVHLTTSDPAANLSATLHGTLENLEVTRIDPEIETTRYRQKIMLSKGKHLDSAGKALLEEDLRSPCTEEIAVFQAFSQVISEANKRFVIMDTAPTGHTLLLLDATGAYHKEVARKMETKQISFSTPMMRLQDSTLTKVIIVTLAEPTPIQEALSLQADLQRAGIEPWAWVVNNTLSLHTLKAPLMLQRVAQQQSYINAVKQQHSQKYAIVPLQAIEPVGVNALQKLCALPA
ncbi:arsenical pump-driving ATPase(arsenite-translocating ATPase) [Psychromonas sp. CNPT3]|uniref:arsenical pump-driving ATPase n=1 Tax=Psychromonas sp. CNPT3 TaxID=314282 RepID=UPI00006E70E2|nr:arsenical pump-driving ATPase [Psychromonas sp. CNPT3]AGH81481.1 arsenical pump-driving ATPase(arsenite-translocating ATPase) [Psychromonas sp. CNPT3]